MACRAAQWSEVVTTATRTKDMDNASFSSFNVDDGLTSLQWLVRPLPCDFSQPGPGHHRQPPPVFSCRQPVSSPEVSPLAADPAPTRTTPAVYIWKQQSLPGIVPRGAPGKKPPYTFPMMICMAMQDSGKSNIPVSCVYQWFVDNFSYFRHHAKPDSWKNSIRHNLSTVKGFISVSRPEDNTGKGGFWTVDPQYAQRILLGAFNKWMKSVQDDPTLQRPPEWGPLLQSPPLQSPPLQSPPLQSPPLQSPPLQSPPLQSPPLPVPQQLIRGLDEATSVEQNQPVKESGRLKRKKHPDSTASVAKVSRRSSSRRLDAEERKELDGLLDWIVSRELSPDPPLPPIQQHQGPELCSVATSAVSCAPPSPPSCALGWLPQSPLVHHQLLGSGLSGELSLLLGSALRSLDSGEPLSSTSPIEDDQTVNFDWGLDSDFLDPALSGDLSLYSGEPLSSTSPVEEDLDFLDSALSEEVVVNDNVDWDAFFESALSGERGDSVDSGEPRC